MQPEALRVIRLSSTALTPETFAPFGDLIPPSGYGKHFGSDDAKLDVSAGQPRLYIMRSPFHGMAFSQITRHRRVTQCLGARNDRDWYLAVAPAREDLSVPELDSITAFHIPGEIAIKLHRGTWHAGPFFTWDAVDFFNLELADTNVTDSQHVDLKETFGVTCEFSEA
jgi:ureidoglycolate lyase